MKKIFYSFCFVCLAFVAKSQNFDKAKMDSLFALIADSSKSMGSLSIFQQGKEVYQKSMGFTDFAQARKADAFSKYRIGSISKTFTAVLILQFIQEGKLRLETTLDTFFPTFPNANRITIAHLLRHRSGLHNFTDDLDYQIYHFKPLSRDSLLAILQRKKTDFAPNAKFSYSNTNYVLLSCIIEKLAKKDFATVLKNRIIKPLRLKNTFYGSKINAKNNEAFSYERKGDTWSLVGETDMNIPIGAGALVATPTDLNIFFEHLFNEKLIKKQWLDSLQVMVQGYGLGVMQVPFYDKKAFGHTGGIDNFSSVAFYFPKEKVGVAYCSNGNQMNNNDILIGALSIYFSKPYQLPNFKTLKISEKELDKYIGIYTSKDIPLKINIKKEQGILKAQATGQSAFPLTAFEQDKFRFESADIIMEFRPEQQKMTLSQNGQVYHFERE